MFRRDMLGKDRIIHFRKDFLPRISRMETPSLLSVPSVKAVVAFPWLRLAALRPQRLIRFPELFSRRRGEPVEAPRSRR